MPTVKIVDRDLGWSDFFRRARQIRSARVKVGVLASDKGGLHEIGPDGKPSPLTVAEIAVVNEFGTEDGHIPARPFVWTTFDQRREELVEAGKKLIGMVLDGKVTVPQALGVMGASLAASIKATIASGVPPPNAPSTVLAKVGVGRTAKFFKKKATTLGEALAQVGSAAAVKTLVDTGRLIGSITWQVIVGE